MGSARAPDFGQTAFFFFLNGMVHNLCEKNKKFPPRARTQLQNRTDPNQYITALFPKVTGLEIIRRLVKD